MLDTQAERLEQQNDEMIDIRQQEIGILKQVACVVAVATRGLADRST